jgi:hypothetical protein
MTTGTGSRRGHGEDSVYFDENRGRYVGAVSLGMSPAGRRLRRKVTGKTKQEVRDKLRLLHTDIDTGAGSSPLYGSGRRGRLALILPTSGTASPYAISSPSTDAAPRSAR